MKHMQQAARIREFLTGRLFLTALDALSLFVFIPVLALYSVKLTCVVLVFTALSGTIVTLLMGPFRRRLYALYQAEGARQALLVETVHGMRTVKSLAWSRCKAECGTIAAPSRFPCGSASRRFQQELNRSPDCSRSS